MDNGTSTLPAEGAWRGATRHALRSHWPEYLMEAWGLGMFMISAGLFATLLEYPGSPVHAALADGGVRRLLMAAAMGLTATALIYSPWGRQSGAHFNPAVTLTYLFLGKVARVDAAAYIAAQFAGGVCGVLAVQFVLGEAFTAPPVHYVATLPGSRGAVAAFVAEAAISFGLMLAVLSLSSSARLARLTGVFAALLVATYITFEAPVSGMSMNPARSFASAAPAGLWQQLWIYFLAPPLGMVAAAFAFVRVRSLAAVHCAKLDHAPDRRCIHCGYEPHASSAAERERAAADPSTQSIEEVRP